MIRFTDDQVLGNVENVLKEISDTCREVEAASISTRPPPGPLLDTGGGVI